MSRQRTLSVHTEHEFLLKLEEAGLTEKLAQVVIGSRGNKRAKEVVEFLEYDRSLPIPANGGSTGTGLPRPATATSATANPYAKENVAQAWHYPKGFAMPSVTDQVERIQKLWPGIDVSHVTVLTERFGTLPEGFDGLEVKPTLRYLGRETADPYGTHYGPMVEKVLALLSQERSGQFTNHRAGQMTERFIRLHAEVRERLQQIEAKTPGDVLVMPVSLGNRYAGYSARNGRFDALSKGFLPNGAAHVGCSLLVIPERLTAYEQLFMDCGGDEWNWGADGEWSRCPVFYFDDGHLQFCAYWADDAGDDYGGVVSCPGVPVSG